MANLSKIILDLCGGTGAWSVPYKQAGYDVRNITLPDYDVRTYIPPENVYGILAAPPCTRFCVSGARWWKNITDQELIEAISIVDACVRIAWRCKPVFWALENPVGRLTSFLGQPKLYFNPCDYGDAWTKKTCLWGKFNVPEKNPVKPEGKNPIHFMSPSARRGELRSITPPSFSKAFFEANQ